MATEIEICNSALLKLGTEPIISLTDNTKQARLCNSQYKRIRDAVLRSAPWSFAVKRARLTPTTTVTLEFGDETVFTLPADCLKVWKVNDGDTRYKKEGKHILAHASVLDIVYVSSASIVNDYDPTFSEAVASALAADLAYSLTQSTTLNQALLSQSEFWINQARSYNSQEQTPDDFKFDTFLNSRRGGHEIF